jgi:hypothetical protein
MARLPSGDFLIQALGDGTVFVFEDHTERQIARFDPTDPEQLQAGMAEIVASELGWDDTFIALFWSGYFYAHAKAAARG